MLYPYAMSGCGALIGCVLLRFGSMCAGKGSEEWSMALCSLS